MIKVCTEKRLPEKIDVKSNKLSEKLNPLSLALETGKLWKPGSQISCYFMEGTDIQKTKVEREAKKWELYANIKLNFSDNKDSDIRISFQDDGSWSYVGTDAQFIGKNEATMNFGWLYDRTADAEYRRVVLHEFGHALGAIHEHQSPAVSIPWNKEAVYEYYQKNQGWTQYDVDVNIFNKYSETKTQFSEFDKDSIMLYSIPSKLTIGGYSVGWNSDLSDMDKEFISKCYPSSNVLEDGLVVGESPIVYTLPAKMFKDYPLEIKQDGRYEVLGYPNSLWISVFDENYKKISYNKRMLRLDLSAGKHIIRIRHSNGDGITRIGVNQL